MATHESPTHVHQGIAAWPNLVQAQGGNHKHEQGRKAAHTQAKLARTFL
jgi:hypothetical protein